MAEPTVSRQTLRRAVCRAAGMTFYRRYPAMQLSLDSDVSDSYIYQAQLTQEDNFWRGGYVYLIEDDVERRIAAFLGHSHRLIPEYPLDSVPTSDVNIEITEIWPPSMIHEAINRANREGGPYYPNTVVDETIIIEENKLRYGLTSLTNTPWFIQQIWAERSSGSITGYATSGSATDIGLDSGLDLSDVDTGWDISIYYGTGKGQIQDVVSKDTSTNAVTVDTWAIAPDTTSKFRLWDAETEDTDYYKFTHWRPDAEEYPSEIWLNELPDAVYGYRMRILMVALPPNLNADSAETQVDQEFIVYKALSILHDERVGDNRADRQMHANLAEYYDSLSRDRARRTRRQLPSMTIRREGPSGPRSAPDDDIGDPLSWFGKK